MKTWTGWICTLVAFVLLHPATQADAAPPWTTLLPFKTVEADPNASYELRDSHGPWLILAASFAGEGAEQQAAELVMELRRRYKIPAYVHRQDYDFTAPVRGLTINRYGDWAKMRHANAAKFEAIAVLVGDFEAVDEPAVAKWLEKIKYARPECLDLKNREWTAQKFSVLREWYRRVNGDESKKNKGPMGNAFVTRNPLLPQSYFAGDGVDDFVANLNRGVKYSLLDNTKRYTVRVASFRGNETINQKEIAELERNGRVTNKLEVAADKAHRLTVALRKKGIEAYEFHDRHESIVTVGGYDSEGKQLADGNIDINPTMLKIMQSYGAAREPLPGQQRVGLQPKTLDGIAFDVQPMPMAVPRKSIGGDYSRRLGMFR